MNINVNNVRGIAISVGKYFINADDIPSLPLLLPDFNPLTAAIRGSGYKLFVKWCRYPGVRLERYLQNGSVIRIASFAHCLKIEKNYFFSYNIYGFAINRMYKNLQYVYLGFSVGVKVVEKLFFEYENKSRCE